MSFNSVTAAPGKFSAEELGLLYRVAHCLLSEKDYGELLTSVLETTMEAIGADRSFVLVREGERFRVAAARNFAAESLTEVEAEISSSISRTAMERGGSLLIGDASDSEEFGNYPSVRRLGLRSVLCAPLVATQEAFALIYLENRDTRNAFTDSHRRLLEEISSMAAPRLRVAVAIEDARKRARELESSLGKTDGILTADAAMMEVLGTVRQIAPTDLPVLIQGETGTGKEPVARALYRHSRRAPGPFVVLNCAAIPAGLVESELFGYLRGAFTGAHRDHIGLIAAAHRGTLFLDEVADLPLELQPRLLRVLQSGEFLRLGSVRPERADVRCIAATNRDLERQVEEGRFRSDLYYRLAAITIKLPPLRNRPHDIRLLADHFLRSFGAQLGREAPHLSSECLQALSSYPFPGNVRELQSEMARLVAMSPPGAVIGSEALNEKIRSGVRPESKLSLEPMSLAEMERRLIRTALQKTGGNRTQAAKILGISREGLRTKMQRLGLSQDFSAPSQAQE